MWRLIGNLSGVEMAYTMGVANALLGVGQAFGWQLTDAQVSAVTAAVNAVLVLVFHLAAKSTASSSSPPPGPPPGVPPRV